MLHHVDGESQVYLDDALAPILVATWIGPATLPLTDHFHRWIDAHAAAALAEGRVSILINDGTAAGAPTAAVRKAFAEHEIPGEFRTYAVVNNALVRGAMTAIGWIVGDRFDVIACKALPEAFERAAAFARERGLTPPPAAVMAGYRVGDRAS